ncbi:MAG: S16 family serine protease [Candidatus Methanospirareceae archaeon]
MGKKTFALVSILLIASVTANIYFLSTQTRAQLNLSELKSQIERLEEANAELSNELYQTNLSLQQARAQLDLYRDQIAELKAEVKKGFVAGEEGSAQLDAPAVMRRVEYSGEYPFYSRQVVEEGTMMQVSVDIRPGYGRVLVETKPLMGVIFQDAANTAVLVAEDYTGCDLSGSDVIFSVEAPSEVSEVDGPSAGALMTTLIIAALENITLPNDVTMTGTIGKDGHVGEIGGVIYKAKAAKEDGKRIFILPRENNQLVRYEEVRKRYGGITIIKQTPVVEDTKEYIEKNIGIHVEYVDSIDDVMRVISLH